MGTAGYANSVEAAILVGAAGCALSYADPGFSRGLYAPGHPGARRHLELWSQPWVEPDSGIQQRVRFLLSALYPAQCKGCEGWLWRCWISWQIQDLVRQ